MVVNRGGGVEADSLTDFTHGWRIAPFLHAGGNDVENFALAGCECFGHGDERTGVRPQGQTPVRRTAVREGA